MVHRQFAHFGWRARRVVVMDKEVVKDCIEATKVVAIIRRALVNKDWIAAGEYGKIAEVARKLIENCNAKAGAGKTQRS